MILAGDVGGTKTNLALYRVTGEELERVEMRTFDSRAHSSLEEILAEFLGGRNVDRVCIGVAGPVFGGKSRLTYLPWTVDAGEVRAASRAREARIVNDMQTMAFAVPFVSSGGFSVLQRGEEDPAGPVAVLAAGTGLGISILLRSGGRIEPLPTEGGHADFAPRDDREFRLHRYLQGRFGRVSVERIVSGPGIRLIYDYLRDVEGMSEEPTVAARIDSGDPSRAIVRAGLSGASPVCREALGFFCSLFGASAGNTALQVLATGGVVLGGSVAPALLPALEEGAFLDSFRAKGHFRALLERVPVRVLRDPTIPLLGAARFALSGGGAPSGGGPPPG